MRRPLALICLLCLLPAAAAAEDFTGVRPLGMGGAHRAVVTSNDAIMLNPAGMSLFKRYSFEAQYLLTPDWRSDGGPEEHIFHISVVDNQLAPFATGLAYTRVERGDSKKGNRYDMAFGVPISENLMLGTDVKYINFDRNGKEDAVDAVTVDLAMLVRFDFGLALGVVGYNLTNTADYTEHPVSMGAALMYSPFRALELAFDWFINFQKPVDATHPVGPKETGYSYHMGVEYLMLGQFLVRGGYLIDQATAGTDDEQYWTAGVGYVTTTLGVDFSYQGSVFHGWGGTFGLAIRLFL